MTAQERADRMRLQARIFNVPVSNVVRQAHANAAALIEDAQACEARGARQIRGYTPAELRAMAADIRAASDLLCAS